MEATVDAKAEAKAKRLADAMLEGEVLSSTKTHGTQAAGAAESRLIQ